MQTDWSNPRRLAAGAWWVASSMLSLANRSRAVQVDGSDTSCGNGVLVMPSASTSSMIQPACATAASLPTRNRICTVSPANSVPKLSVTGASAGNPGLTPLYAWRPASGLSEPTNSAPV